MEETGSRNPKWRPLPLYCIYICLQTRELRDYNGHSYIFGSGIPMGQVLTSYNRIGRNRKWKIQDGGLYHWNTYISAPIQDSYAIPMSMPQFSGSNIPMERHVTTYHRSKRNGKYKIQAGGPYHGTAYISSPRLDSNAIPTAIPMFLGSGIPMGK